MRKVFLALLVVLLTVSMAVAAENSALVGGSSGGDNSLEQEIEGGITVKATTVSTVDLMGIVVANFLITAEEDTTIKVGAPAMYDNLGNQFDSIYRILIGGNDTSERLIIGGVPTKVEIYYRCDRNYKLASAFPRVGLSVNGKNVNFRNVPGGQ